VASCWLLPSSIPIDVPTYVRVTCAARTKGQQFGGRQKPWKIMNP